MEGPPETLWQTGQAKTVPSFQPACTMGKYTRRHTVSTPKDWPTGRKNSQISVTISGGRPTFPGTLANKPKQKRPVFQPAGTMGSTTEVTVSTPKTYQTAKKNTAFARTACHKGWQNKPSKSVPSLQPAGTMGSTTEVTVSTPKTYQTAKKNTAFARSVSQRS